MPSRKRSGLGVTRRPRTLGGVAGTMGRAAASGSCFSVVRRVGGGCVGQRRPAIIRVRCTGCSWSSFRAIGPQVIARLLRNSCGRFGYRSRQLRSHSTPSYALPRQAERERDQRIKRVLRRPPVSRKYQAVQRGRRSAARLARRWWVRSGAGPDALGRPSGGKPKIARYPRCRPKIPFSC